MTAMTDNREAPLATQGRKSSRQGLSPIQERLTSTVARLPEHVKLVAVSKFHPAEAIADAYQTGWRIYGESRAQELVEKHEILPSDIEWHFIGHLQPNKVKYIAPFVTLIHAVDSFKLLAEIDKQARRCDRIIPCLLQLHVAQEETKFGFTPEECQALLAQGEWRDLHHVQISGLMCMASNTDDTDRIRRDFRTAYDFYKSAKNEFFSDCPEFCERSWGMSGDYDIAIEEGSTMVRIGTHIFGERNYDE